MKDLEIDNYLAEMVVAIDDLGGRVNLVGLCQGGWLSAMVAARFPNKVNFLVLAGAPIDLPGRWYLQAISQLFQENRLAKGEFVGLGRKLNLRNITCPAYLLAGAADDITTPEQVLDAVKYLGTPKDRIVQKTVPGGHIGLFMGARTLSEHWPGIARWIAAQ